MRGIRGKNLNSLSNYSNLAIAFDNLLPIIGLWDRIKLSTLYTIMAIRCDEVGSSSTKAFNLLILVIGNLTLPWIY